jgi:AAA domain
VSGRNLSDEEWLASIDRLTAADLDQIPEPPPASTDTKSPGKAEADPFADAITFADLDKMTFRPQSYLVPHLIVRGGVVLGAGPPKIGKSFLALGIGLAVAQGGVALGALQVTQPGPVLFISLDDTSTARAQDRARMINGGEPLPALMTLHTKHNLGRGEQARDVLARYLRTRGRGTVLLVIDTLSHLRGDRGHTEGVYDADVRFMTLIRTLVPDNPDTTFWGLAHIRKQAADDGLQAVSGTYGITGGADSVITMTGNRHAPGRALEVINRDDAGGEYALRFTDHGLIFTDDDPHDPALFMSRDDAAVYRALVGCDGPATAGDLAAMLPELSKIGDRLARLVQHNAARRVRRGTYEAL